MYRETKSTTESIGEKWRKTGGAGRETHSLNTVGICS